MLWTEQQKMITGGIALQNSINELLTDHKSGLCLHCLLNICTFPGFLLCRNCCLIPSSLVHMIWVRRHQLYRVQETLSNGADSL